MTTRSAIRTRFVGPTNYRPARIIASDDGSPVVLPVGKVVTGDILLRVMNANTGATGGAVKHAGGWSQSVAKSAGTASAKPVLRFALNTTWAVHDLALQRIARHLHGE